MFSGEMLNSRWLPTEPASVKTIDGCVKTVEGIAGLTGAKAWQWEGTVWTGTRVPVAVKRGLALMLEMAQDEGGDQFGVAFTAPGVWCSWYFPLHANSSKPYAWFSLIFERPPSASKVGALLRLVADVWSPPFVATCHVVPTRYGSDEGAPAGFEDVHWDGRPTIGIMCYLQSEPPRIPRGVRVVPHGTGVIVRIGTGPVWSHGRSVVRKLDRVQQAMGLEPTIAYRWCRFWAREFGVRLAQEGGKRELTRTEAIELKAKQRKRGLSV
jgi:hypothetical protein